MSRPIIRFLLAASFLGGAASAFADVKMPAIFGDHMVLQQETVLPVWGTAAPGESVTVTVGSKTARATAAADGVWRVELPAFPAGSPATTMTVAGKNTLTFQDVLIGDVWLCGGQSNMQFGLGAAHNAATVLPQANDPELRYFVVHLKVALDPQPDVNGNWVICNPKNAERFSAAGYFFARDLRERLKRPIGLIGSNWGGTPAQAWMSLEGLAREPTLKHYVDAYEKLKAGYPQALAEYPAKQAAYQEELAKWKQDHATGSTPAPTPGNDALHPALSANQIAPPKPGASPAPPPAPEGGTGTPTGLYNGMIAPIIPYPMKGVIWYQGESNAGNNYEYRTLFAALINDWRQHWDEGAMPFIFAQITSSAGHYWAVLRESQLQTLALPNTGMIVTTDIGDPFNVHPKDKLDVGLRFALAARHLAYGENIVYSGPIYQSMKVEGGTIRLSFTQTGGGLVIAGPPYNRPYAAPIPTDHLVGFKIAGADRNFFPAQAVISNGTVVVSSPQVPQPASVRYAWENIVTANLYNKEGLPASPFRTDDWDDVIKKADNQPAPPPETPPPGAPAAKP